jgi:hypothetical protein
VHHPVGTVRHTARVERRLTTGEASRRQVEASPEEMDRARLAGEAGAEHIEQAVGLDEGVPEALDRFSVVAGVLGVLGERDRDGHLVRPGEERDADAELAEDAHRLGVEARHRPRFEGDDPGVAVRGAHHQCVVEEVKLDVEARRLGVHQRGRQPAT